MRTIEESTPASTTSLARRRADLERYEAQVAEWTALIGQYRAGARRLGTPDRLALDHITDELQLRRNEASAQVLRLKNSVETEWEHEKAELEQAWQAIRFVFRKAKARF